MSSASIIVKNISAQQFGKTVLDNISFTIEAGQHLAVIGESGSGKSSLAKALAGKLFTKGSIEINYTHHSFLKPTTVLLESSETLKNLSNVSDFYYQQRYNSCDAEDALTVEQELEKTIGASSEVDLLLNQLSLSHRRQTPLIQLSNGEQKKLQLIKALVLQPQVLILDNVFVGLDVSSRKELHHIIDELAKKGTTLILVTDERELPSCITHIAELFNGKLVQAGERKTFVAFHPENAREDKNNINASLFSGRIDKYDNIVKMKNVTIQYGDKIILQNINWEVKQGEHWLVKGHNGAGKSTLLSLITADNPQAYSQEIFLFDKRRGTGESIWDIKKKIGFVSPELHKFFDMGTSVHNVIGSGFFDTMGLFRLLSNEQEQMVNEWLEFFDLTDQREKPLFLLSTGQQRKALLARALIKNPALLVLDEPCQGLDDHQTKHFLQLIDSICNCSATTLIYVSHYDNEIPASILQKMELQQGKQISLIKPQPITV
ncbi:ATP-binding cassette domain-containing protein [Terrimonas pollutisoli]|uniref:ATP-binding cassette domain-containing protein n=1 Tax=Terrimonas pollutisoli TaxID=3034147 RepID=UPI0023EDC40A|nr:ATP-binding cassette domain-containing protein [Terrimonas sp. H1YJ31]